MPIKYTEQATRFKYKQNATPFFQFDTVIQEI